MRLLTPLKTNEVYSSVQCFYPVTMVMIYNSSLLVLFQPLE